MQTVGRLAVRVKALEPGDTLGKAAEIVRASCVNAAPVLLDGHFVGLVTPAILADALSSGSPQQFKERTLGELPLERAVILPEGMPASVALQLFESNAMTSAPVQDAFGGLVGMVSTAELVSAVCGRVRPPIVGGMATPFGVYLTGGGVRGGVGDLALMTTGMYIALLHIVALYLVLWLQTSDTVSRFAPTFGHWLATVPTDLPMYLLFALFFRLSWITGFHAAEHQVVHTLEAGDDLRPEIVARKPRVHPRCGTNIVAAAMIAEFFWPHPTSWFGLQINFGEGGSFLALVAVFFLWRRVGAILQQYVTTRPASPGQLESGIRAARQLMDRYQNEPPHRLSVWHRIWNMGLLQVVAGAVLVFSLLELLEKIPGFPGALRL
jgi:CBS domain-containing protein